MPIALFFVTLLVGMIFGFLLLFAILWKLQVTENANQDKEDWKNMYFKLVAELHAENQTTTY